MKVSEPETLIETLKWVGQVKNRMPFQLRWWLNELGLFVQLRDLTPERHLMAGGKFRKYFHAVGSIDPITAEIKSWDVRRFERQTWDSRFAQLVWPTFEVTGYIGRVFGDQPIHSSGGPAVRLSELDTEPLEEFVQQVSLHIKEVIESFRATGTWQGLFDFRCESCDKSLAVWDKHRGQCPHCGTLSLPEGTSTQL